MLRRSAAACVVLALFALGCGDEATPTPKGSLFVTIAGATDPPVGGQCPDAAGHDKNVGFPAPTADDPGQRVEIGGCKVTSDGAFTGKISRSSAEGTVSFSMSGNVIPGGTGQGQLVYYDDRLVATMESPPDNPCTVWVNEGKMQIAGGRIWAKFSCPQIIEQPNWYCGANGTFVMENCSK